MASFGMPFVLAEKIFFIKVNHFPIVMNVISKGQDYLKKRGEQDAE